MLGCFKSRDDKGVEFAVKEGLRIEELTSGQKDDCIRLQLKDSSKIRIGWSETRHTCIWLNKPPTS